MSGTELAAFAFGVSGAFTFIEKSFQIFKAIEEARAFGSDLTGIVAQLCMESTRFYTWVRLSGILDIHGSPTNGTHAPSGPFATTSSSSTAGALNKTPLWDDIDSAIMIAMSSIVLELEKVHEIVKKYKIKRSSIGPTTGPPTVDIQAPESPQIVLGIGDVLPSLVLRASSDLNEAVFKRRKTESMMQRKSSFQVRFLFAAKPWGTADKKELQGKIAQICYWNDRLERMLHPRLAQSVREHAIPGNLLRDENRAMLEAMVQEPRNEVNQATQDLAQLWKLKQKLESEPIPVLANEGSGAYQFNVRDLSQENISNKDSKLRLHILSKPGTAPIKVVAEIFPLESMGSGLDRGLVISRVKQLIHLASHPSTPSSLRLLKPTGFLDDGQCLKIVYNIPPKVSATKPPVSLYTILADIRKYPRPALDERFRLALQLTNAVYSLGLIRWYHKNLMPHNIVFFDPPEGSRLLDDPCIIGFSVARPDGREEKSLNDLVNYEVTHLHPELRVQDQRLRPPYERRFEIWSLGVLLFEIALWRPIESIVTRVKAQSELFPKMIKEKAEKEIPFYMGKQYKDVVMACLNFGNVAADESEDREYYSDSDDTDGEREQEQKNKNGRGEDHQNEENGEGEWEMNHLYFNVVAELARCQIPR